MKTRSSVWVVVFLLVLSFGVTFWGLQEGSIHNSDDALYAQVMREVSLGSWFPLTFLGNEYAAKPPLAFWFGGAAVSLVGDHEGAFRLLGALSFFLLVAMAGLLLFREAGGWPAVWVILLFWGCSFLTLHSRRVMLDLPTAAWAMGLLLAFLRLKKTRWWWFWGLSLAGWWTKQYLILPPMAAVLALLMLEEREVLRDRRFWLPCLGFLSGVGLWSWLNAQATLANNLALGAIQSDVLAVKPLQDVYGQVIFSETPWFWLVPLALIWLVLKRKEVSRAPKVFGLAVVFQGLAVFFTQTHLPHYLLPAYVYGLVLVAFFLVYIQSHLKRGGRVFSLGVLLLIAWQAGAANQFRWQHGHPDFDPSPATKKLAQASETFLPEGAPLCVVDAYFVGFAFYSQRSTYGIYTSPTAFEAIASIGEFQGRVVPSEFSNIPAVVGRHCGGWAIAPRKLIEHFEGHILSQAPAGSLALAKFN